MTKSSPLAGQLANALGSSRDRAALLVDFDALVAGLRPGQLPTALPAVLYGIHRALGGAMALISNRSIDELDVRLAPVRLPVLALGGRQWRGTPAQPAEVRRFADCATALAEGLGDDPHFAGRDLCVVGPANAALIDLDLDRAAPADDETASAEMISALSTALAQRLS